jgi:hypothetical protein
MKTGTVISVIGTAGVMPITTTKTPLDGAEAILAAIAGFQFFEYGLR